MPRKPSHKKDFEAMTTAIAKYIEGQLSLVLDLETYKLKDGYPSIHVQQGLYTNTVNIEIELEGVPPRRELPPL